MSTARVAGRYAKSLLDLAVDQGKLDQVVADVQGIQNTLENRDFYLLLKSPIVNSAKKLSIFKSLFDGKISDVTMKFLERVISKRREAFIPEMTSSFTSMYRDMQGVTTVALTVAQEPTDAFIQSIKDKLRSSAQITGDVTIETKVDPAIIGGYVLEFNHQRLDASVAHQLETLKKSFSN